MLTVNAHRILTVNKWMNESFIHYECALHSDCFVCVSCSVVDFVRVRTYTTLSQDYNY